MQQLESIFKNSVFLIIWLPGASREEGALRFSTMAEEGEEGASLGVIAFIIYQHDLRHQINLETPTLSVVALLLTGCSRGGHPNMKEIGG